MIYDIRLVTASTYDAPVPFARHVLRCMPRARPNLNILAASLTIDPEPAALTIDTDFFGNDARTISIETQHQKLIVHAALRVECKGQTPPDPEATPAWEEVRDQALAAPSLAPEAPAHFLFESRIVKLDPEIAAFAAQSFPEGVPILQGALDLMARLHREIAFDNAATHVETMPGEAFAMKRGVCQDFTHIMIAGLRSLGLPAAYASGFLRTLPAPGQPRLEGVDATHAWVRLWCGEELGWVEIDPTNAMFADESHVLIAIGRDYADVAPLDGVIITYGGQKLEVAVDVAPV